MKKVLIILCCLILFVGCTKKDTEPYTEISYDELEIMLKEKQDFVLVLGSSQCSHCASYKITMEDVVAKYHVTIHYIDIYELSDEQLSKLNNKFSFSGTPTTIFIEGGEEKDPQFNRIDGAKDFEYIVSKLKDNGYIKE